MKASKKMIIIIILSIVLSILLIAGVVAGVLYFPSKGKVSNEIWLPTDKYDISNTVVLEKKPNKEFKILNLADIQFGDTLDFGQRGLTKDTVKALIEQEKPDLITLTGDQVWTQTQRFSQKEFCKMMDSFGIPWAPVFGNHDGEGNVDKNWLADRYMESEYCLFKKGPNNIGGVGNYIVNIMENGKIAESLIFMDSGASKSYEGIRDEQKLYGKALDDTFKGYVKNSDGTVKIDEYGTDYDFIDQDQIQWYKWAVEGAKQFNKGENVDSILFFHIALPEFHLAYTEWLDSGFDSAKGFGEMNEQICCPKVNSGFFNVIKELDSTKNIVVGHDHINNFSVMYKGIRLTYGLKTGDRCYSKPELNGGTVLKINDNSVITEHKYIKVKS